MQPMVPYAILRKRKQAEPQRGHVRANTLTIRPRNKPAVADHTGTTGHQVLHRPRSLPMLNRPLALTTVAHADSDGDGVTDCRDGCPADPFKTEPGLCGCGLPEDDSLPSVCQGSFGFSLTINGRNGQDSFVGLRTAVSIRRFPRLYLLPATCIASMVPVCSPYSVNRSVPMCFAEKVKKAWPRQGARSLGQAVNAQHH